MISYEHIYEYTTYIIYFLYFVILFGLWNDAPQYLNAIEYFLQIFIGILLVLFNNPFTKHKYRPIDKKIAFSAGLFILASTTLTTFLHRLIDPLQKNNDTL